MRTLRIQSISAVNSGSGGPFDLTDEGAYRAWRTNKLREYPHSCGELIVPLRDPSRLSDAELDAIRRRCCKANMAIYQLPSGLAFDKQALRALGVQLGLDHLDSNLCADEDGVTALQVVTDGRHIHYIPYTNRPLNWHTDGYYNPAARQIRAILMHCVRPAARGGENALLDHELVYIYLRDTNPDYIAALTQTDAMSIPPNTEGDTTVRGTQDGPVFSVHPSDGTLHMRYTARARNVHWKQDPLTLAAAAQLQALLTGPTPGILHHRLEAGQGIICNNVVHNRSRFENETGEGRGRLLYRARYYDRVQNTDGPACQCLDPAHDLA